MEKFDLEDYAKGSVTLFFQQVTTYKEEITNANIIEVEAGTTGYKGGDSGHGGRTYFRLKDLASTDLTVSVRDADGTIREFNTGEVALMFGGDSELDTFIDALDFTLNVLNAQRYGVTKKLTNLEKRQRSFREYLSEVVDLYRKTGSLKGMSDIQRKHKVSSITKQQFFEKGLHEAARSDTYMLDKEFCRNAYAYVLSGTKVGPIPKYEIKKK